MTFEEYCEEMHDLQIFLLSEDEIKELQKSFDAFKKSNFLRKASNPDLKIKSCELRERCERLIRGQKNAIAKVIQSGIKCEYAIEQACSSVEFGEKLLTSRGTKKQFVEHFEMNSAASRLMNAVRKQGKI